MTINKSVATNGVAVFLVLAGLTATDNREQILSVGLFALSGGLTNWLAIHMLFEKVPYLYGSGVIPNRFEEFKLAIKQLIMNQFFSQDNIRRIIKDEEASVANWVKPGNMADAVDYNKVFDRLVDAIMSSSFGGMVGMLGGADALQSLRESFIEKIRSTITEMLESERFKNALAQSIDEERLSADLQSKVEAIVDQRLDELTPKMVKEMVQELIREHLGWLVVWGGVFGGFIGLIVSWF